MPWVDPLKETQADILQIEKRIKSRHQVIRERCGDPRLVDREIAADKLMVDEDQQSVSTDEETQTDEDMNDQEENVA